MFPFHFCFPLSLAISISLYMQCPFTMYRNHLLRCFQQFLFGPYPFRMEAIMALQRFLYFDCHANLGKWWSGCHLFSARSGFRILLLIDIQVWKSQSALLCNPYIWNISDIFMTLVRKWMQHTRRKFKLHSPIKPFRVYSLSYLPEL